MSVTTEADEAIERLRVGVQTALEIASETVQKIVVHGCWGSDEISAAYRQSLVRAHASLINMRDELAP